MRIADAAARLGVPAHRLRHYEATGLLVPARSPAGYRDYSPDDVERGQQIKALFDVGFSAADVTLMLPCLLPPGPDGDRDDDRRCCAVTRARLTDRLDQIRRRRTALERTEGALAEWLAAPS